MDEKEKQKIQEELQKIKGRKEAALKKASEELEKVDQNRDPQTYAEGQDEVNRRNEELEKINKEINSFNKVNEDIENLNIEPLKKDMKQKEETLNKVKDELKKLNEQKDPKLYSEIEYEISRRQEEFNKSKEAYDTAINKEKELKTKIENLKDIFSKKYHIDVKETNKDSKKNDQNKDNNQKDNNQKDNNQSASSKKPERDENGNLKNPPVMRPTTTLAKPAEKKYIPERDENGNLKNPPVLRPTTTLAKVDKKLSIVYSGKDNKYIVMNFEGILEGAKIEDEKVKSNYIKNMTDILSQPIDAINFKNKKEKIEYLKNEFDEEELAHIFGEEYEKTMKKMAKTYDPQLLVLLADLDMNFANKYINELSKDKDEEKQPLPYSMKYNLKGMKKNHKNNKMSFIQRIRTNRMAKRNYKMGVAEYVSDDKSRKWLAVPAAGLLAAGGIALANQDKEEEKPEQDYTPKVTDATQEAPVKSTVEEYIVEEDINQDNKADLSLGSKVNLSDGLTYTEDSLGNGVTGKIGEVSWRPAGEYTIDRVAIYHDGTLLENLSAEGTNVDEVVRKYAKQLGIEPSEIEQKAHICLGEKHVGPTGWLNMKEMSMQDIKNNISKTYEELQKEKEANNKQQAQKATQEQNHESR